MLELEELFILKELYYSNGTLGLKEATASYRTAYTLSIDDFKPYNNGQPKWLYLLRKGHQSLKDKGLIVGNEFSTWSLTSPGEQLIVKLINEDHDILNKLTNIAFVDEAEPPPAIATVVYRKIRDTLLSASLKQKYEHYCQICEERISLGNKNFYSEGHHLKPLGNPHNGPDIVTNLIVLCPNHHVEFDHVAIAVNPETLLIEHMDEDNEFVGFPLRLQLHVIGQNFLTYHYKLFLQKKRA